MREFPKPNWKWRADFLRGYLNGNLSFTGPFAAIFDVTQRCNLSCIGCRWHSPASDNYELRGRKLSDFDLEVFTQLCRQLRELGTAKMTLTGQGEPLLHPRLVEMVKLAKESGFYLKLLTNGTMLDRQRAEALVSAGLDQLQVSLWASNLREYELNYPQTNPHFFESVVKGVQLLHQTRKEQQSRFPKIILHRPIERDFYPELGSMIDLALDMGCDALTFSPLKPLGGVDKEKGLQPDEERALAFILRDLEKRAQSCGLETNIPAVLQRYQIGQKVWKSCPCYVGWIDVRIRVNGDVLACDPCSQVMGNIRQSKIDEIWNFPAFLAFRGAVRTREGLEQMARYCDCRFCCHVLTNSRLYRILKWFPGLS